MAKTPLFDCLDAINFKKPYKYKKSDCSGYMLVMWLSHDPSLIDICNEINQHVFHLKDDLIFKYFLRKVPKKRRFLKWTKKSKESEIKEKEIQKLMDEYGISSREAKLSLR